MVSLELKNEPYGPHERNVFDLYTAESTSPTPLLIMIHGGGFKGGDKAGALDLAPFRKCLAAGISVATINYRLTDSAPFPAQMHDAARALQYIRANARNWNIDPTRVAASGGSAGSGISQWLAFHEDLADPTSDDPVARESTKVSCVVAIRAQSTYDPRLIKEIVPGKAYDHVAMKLLFGVDPTFDWDRDTIPPKVLERIKECGPITHLKKGAPPVLVKHEARQNTDGNIHHPNFGKHLEENMKHIGSECIRRMDTDYDDGDEGFKKEFLSFLKKHLKV